MAKKILVVDDDPDILDALSLTLEYAGFKVDTTDQNGQEMLNKLKQGGADLIILDMLLSGSDGRTICRQLKADQRTNRIPVIMISAHPDAKKTTIEAGADDFLAKPFNVSDLLRKVKNYVH
jgi:DNA-binding response OmpR family regulator